VVPVLRNVENLNYAEIEKALNEIGEKVGNTIRVIRQSKQLDI
jgi:pyruvate/2-oxoglutarate dehydrogenase complex dihydrolipoamide acyltransferase (E2) component